MRRLALLLLVLAVSSGCATAGYRSAVVQFAAATTTVSAAVKAQLMQADVQARDQAIWEAYAGFEPEALASMKAPKGRAFNTKSGLTDDQRAVRRDALKVLTKYGGLLRSLAEAESPKDAKKASIKLGDAVSDISEQVGMKITGADGADAQLVAFASGATHLFGAILEVILKVAIQDALDTAIVAGEEPIKKLAKAIELDLTALHKDRQAWLSERKIVFKTALQHTVAAAREDPGHLLGVIELTERVDAADKALKLWNAVSPASVAKALVAAHDKLRVYAQGGHKKEALSEAVTAIYALGEAAYQLVNALVGLDPALLENP
jgi:hypothetical protein